MRQYTFNSPLGTDAETDVAQRVLKMVMEQLQMYNSSGIRWQQTPRGIRLRVSVPPAKGGGPFPWQMPNKELDPTVAVTKDTFVYISPQNPMVVTGLYDLTQMSVIKASPGIWQALQDVPIQDTSTMTTKYNVPQPLAQGATSGVPLTGDADDASEFWIQWAGISICG